MSTQTLAPTTESRLRSSCLSFSEVLAQAIALISPTMTAALIVPLMYGNAGNGSWLAYLFGTIMLLFVALNLNQFAKRSTSAGSMFAYTFRGLGPTAGALSGWCLIWSYLCIGTAGMTGFTIFAQKLLEMAGIHTPVILLFVVCASIAFYLAYKDIQLSTILMLILEGVSVSLILALAVVILSKHGFAPDMDQLSLKGASLPGISLGVVVAIFSLVGFECATAFGEEAKNPLKTIPKAVIWSLMLTGLFFVIVSYVEVLGLKNNATSLDKLDAPLNTLADLMRVRFLKIPIDIGAMASFFSLALSCLNAGARILYPMGRHGIFHAAIGQTHEKHATPHIAVTVFSILLFLVPTGMILSHIAVLDAFNFAGTFGAFGFLAAYFLISVAAPLYLKKIGELKPADIVLSVLAVLFLLVPAVGSVYPVPAPPVNKFPYIFLAYFLVGFVWFTILRKRSPGVIEDIQHDLESVHGRLGVSTEEPVAA